MYFGECINLLIIRAATINVARCNFAGNARVVCANNDGYNYIFVRDYEIVIFLVEYRNIVKNGRESNGFAIYLSKAKNGVKTSLKRFVL